MAKRKRKHRGLLRTSDTGDQTIVESSSQAKTPDDVDKGKQPLEEMPEPPEETSEPPEEMPEPPEEMPEPPEEMPEPPEETSEPPEEMPEPPDFLRGETLYRNACKKYFKRLLQDHAYPGARVLRSGTLSTVLQSLGMAPEVTEEELCGMLKTSGYADDNGTLGFEQFLILAKDFKLLESIHVRDKERERGNTVDRGLLGQFFEILDVGEETGFSSADFADALGRLSSEITEETADNLVRYAYLESGVPITFAQFEKMIYKERQHNMQSGNT